MPRERTHWEGCWRTHHECALVRVEALEIKLEAREKRVAELEAALAERTASELDKSPDLEVPNNDMVICPKCVHQFRAIPVSVQHELADERERRKAAEALLHNYSRLADAAMFDANRSGYEYDRKGEMVDISAHFARYKD